MPYTLFVNACMRGAQSRTLELCREYLDGKDSVAEVDLAALGLVPYSAGMVDERVALQEAQRFDDPVFDLGRQFAEADEIVIGAPYWDLSFPAALKVYFEHVSVNGLVFRFTEEGVSEGRCKARHITYITTSGGFLEGFNLGYDYVAGLARMFGIPEVRLVAAEGLDVEALDAGVQMDKARSTLRALRPAGIAV